MKDINKLLKEEQVLQNKINTLLKEVKEEIYNAILTTPIKGVKQQTSTLPCAVVSFSALSTSGILSAEYYIPKAQADLINNVLDRANTLTQLKKEIANIVKTKTVKSHSITYSVNDTTIGILKKYL